MKSALTLVVLAAGLGSRYGGLKQLDGFGPNGEPILDYTLYDAISAGFNKVAFVIRKSIERDFLSYYAERLKGKIEVDYVFQEIDNLSGDFTAPVGRKKPWGTGHAVLVAKDKVDGNFGIVNADDFYGKNSIQLLGKQLLTLDRNVQSACMVGFQIEKTLSAFGTVSRGICQLNTFNQLERIVEKVSLGKETDGKIYSTQEGKKEEIKTGTMISMNLMGFSLPVFNLLEDMFNNFLEDNVNSLKSEFYIPEILNQLITVGTKIPVFKTSDQWFGITYREDRDVVQKKLIELVKNGVYPKDLWKN